MKKLFLAVALLFTIGLVAQEQPSGISVNGEGTITVVPDEVLIQVYIQEEASSAQKVKENNEKNSELKM